MSKLVEFPWISQNSLTKALQVQNALARLRKLDQRNRKRLRQLILAGARTEAGPRYVEIQRTATGHRLIVR